MESNNKNNKIDAEPPDIVKNIKWIFQNWTKKPFLVLLAILVLAIPLLISFFSNNSNDKSGTYLFYNSPVQPKNHSNTYFVGRDLIIKVPDDSDQRYFQHKKNAFSAKFKIAIANLKSGNFQKAADLFSKIYDRNPEYPTLALKYGKALAELKRYNEAISVWLSIPNTEHYTFINFLIGSLYYEQNMDGEALKYLKLSLNDLTRDSCRYWAARVMIILIRNKNAPIENFKLDTTKFIEVVDNDIQNITRFRYKPDTTYEIDEEEIKHKVLIRQSSAFILLTKFAYKLRETEDEWCSCIPYLVDAYKRLWTNTIGCVWKIDKYEYKRFLNDFGISLGYCKTHGKLPPKLKKYVKVNYQRNVDVKNYQYSDFAQLLDFFILESESLPKLKVGSFELIYELAFKDDSGIDLIKIESPDYLVGGKKIKGNGKRYFSHSIKISINTSTQFNEKPYLKCKVRDIFGNVGDFFYYPYVKFKMN